jgi:hypothetical protein
LNLRNKGVTLLKRTNIEARLSKVRDRQISEQRLLQDIYKILTEDSRKEERIEKALAGKEPKLANAFNFDLLETKNIYHLDQLKEICIDYRLRFLDTKYFKGDIPKEAIHKIKRLEKLHNIELQGYKIIAPS